MARLIPVLDVMGGRVVRAVGGRRSEYKPLVSKLTDSTEPATVARKLLDATGAAELYLADIDALVGGVDVLNEAAIRAVCDLGMPVWADIGLRAPFDETVLQSAGCGHFVVATESAWGEGNDLNPYGVVAHIAEMEDPDRLALSIDSAGRRLLGHWKYWGGTQAEAFKRMVSDAVECGYRRVIVLDVQAVGGQGGPTTLRRVRWIRRHHPDLEIWTGGGVRNRDDMNRVADAGADAVLVASALNDGTLP